MTEARKPDYIAECACGKFAVELFGEPLVVGSCKQADCHCNDCVTACSYVDEKAKAAGIKNISALSAAGGMSTKAWFLDNLKVVRGIELLAGFKMSPGSPICRTYTSCCYTSVIDFGNAKMPRWRTFNRNTIKNAATGQRVVYDDSETDHLMTKFGKAETVEKLPADRKYSFAPMGVIPFVVSTIFFPWFHKGCETVVTPEMKVPGLFVDIKEVTEIAPPAAYEVAGFKIPKSARA